MSYDHSPQFAAASPRGWQQPLSIPLAAANAQQGWTFAPLNTAQITPPPLTGQSPHNLHFHVTVGRLKSF